MTAGSPLQAHYDYRHLGSGVAWVIGAGTSIRIRGMPKDG